MDNKSFVSPSIIEFMVVRSKEAIVTSKNSTLFNLFYEGRKITQLRNPMLTQNRLYWARPSSGLIVGMVVEVQVEMGPGAELPVLAFPSDGSLTMAGIIKKDERNRFYIDLD